MTITRIVSLLHLRRQLLLGLLGRIHHRRGPGRKRAVPLVLASHVSLTNHRPGAISGLTSPNERLIMTYIPVVPEGCLMDDRGAQYPLTQGLRTIPLELILI